MTQLTDIFRMPFIFSGHIFRRIKAKRAVFSRFQWFFGDRELGADNSLGLSVTTVDEFTSSLSFATLETRHSGNYTCVAGNAAARDQHSANLAVNSEFMLRIS